MHTLVRYINVLVNFQTRNKLIKLILTVQCRVVCVCFKAGNGDKIERLPKTFTCVPKCW